MALVCEGFEVSRLTGDLKTVIPMFSEIEPPFHITLTRSALVP